MIRKRSRWSNNCSPLPPLCNVHLSRKHGKLKWGLCLMFLLCEGNSCWQLRSWFNVFVFSLASLSSHPLTWLPLHDSVRLLYFTSFLPIRINIKITAARTQDLSSESGLSRSAKETPHTQLQPWAGLVSSGGSGVILTDVRDRCITKTTFYNQENTWDSRHNAPWTFNGIQSPDLWLDRS